MRTCSCSVAKCKAPSAVGRAVRAFLSVRCCDSGLHSINTKVGALEQRKATCPIVFHACMRKVDSTRC